MTLTETINAVRPLDETSMAAAKKRFAAKRFISS